MAVEQVARWPWNAWPDESGLGGRMAWNPQLSIAIRSLDNKAPPLAQNSFLFSVIKKQSTSAVMN